MDELLFQEIMRSLRPAPRAAAPADPRMEAKALLLSRLAQQDATRLESVTPGRRNPIVDAAINLTPFGDTGEIVSALEEGEHGRAGLATLLALLGTAGGVGVGRRVLRGRRAVREAAEAADLMQGAEREVFRSLTQQARERAQRMGGQVAADPIAELNRLLQRGPQ